MPSTKARVEQIERAAKAKLAAALEPNLTPSELPLPSRRGQPTLRAAFGHDDVGTIGTPTTITSGDLDGILMIAAQALEKRTEELKGENAQLRAKLESLERRIGNCAP